MQGYGKILVDIATTKGTHSSNQDGVLFFNRSTGSDVVQREHYVGKRRTISFDETPLVVAVADGVGGEAYGELASRTALEVISDCFADLGGERDSEMLTEQFFAEAFSKANSAVVELSRKKMRSTATTLTVLLILGEKYFLGNIGDSPAYLVSEDGRIRLTEEHTKSAEKECVGVTVKESDHHQLTKYIGNAYEEGSEMVNVVQGECKQGDVFVLYSDGLEKEFSVDRALDKLTIIEEGEFRRFFEDLRDGEAQDDCTVIRLKMETANTTFLKERISHVDSDTEIMEILSAGDRYSQGWEKTIAQLLYNMAEKKKIISKDWGVSERAVGTWFKEEPSRDNILRICWSLGYTIEKTNKMISHYASYGTLDENDLSDASWIDLIGEPKEKVEEKGGPEKYLESFRSANKEKYPEELSRWYELRTEIYDRWEKKGTDINMLWENSEAKATAYRLLNEGKAKKGQKLPRYFLVALGIKEGLGKDEINDCLAKNGMEALSKRTTHSIFDGVLSETLQKIECEYPQLLGTDNLMGTETSDRVMGLETDMETLEDMVCGRLDELLESVNEDLKESFQSSYNILLNYLG